MKEIATQILNDRIIKKFTKNQNIKLRKESKGFTLNVAKSISNEQDF